jgi:hypothetical protein
MSFYVYEPVEKEFLAENKSTWTESMFLAANFDSREAAEHAATSELGEGHGAFVLDDGIES